MRGLGQAEPRGAGEDAAGPEVGWSREDCGLEFKGEKEKRQLGILCMECLRVMVDSCREA